MWRLSHFGFSHPWGVFPEVTGSVTLDSDHPENSKVVADIDIKKLVTGLDKFNAHIKSADFLNAAKFPTAKFVSDKVTVTGKDTAKIDGTLTLMNVAKPITLDVTLNKQALHPMTKQKAVGFTATTTIKRADFGISKYVPDVSDDVEIRIEAEAQVEAPKPTAATKESK